MRRCCRVLACMSLTVAWTAMAYAQQQPSSLGGKARNTKLATAGLRPSGRMFLGRFDTKRDTLFMHTRIDRLRAVSPLSSRREGFLLDLPYPRSPIRYYLEQRNYLKARSPLAMSSMPGIGEFGELAARETRVQGPPLPDVARTATSMPAVDATANARSFNDSLAARLQAKADDYFELGTTYFRNGDLTRARHYFEMTRDLRGNDAKPYVASMMVSLQLYDYGQGIAELLRALQLARTPDDLRIEDLVERFFPGEDSNAKQKAFARLVDQVNSAAQASGPSSPVNILRAYYAWLDGDVGSALSAADLARQAIGEPQSADVLKFRGWIAGEGQPAKTPEPAAS